MIQNPTFAHNPKGMDAPSAAREYNDRVSQIGYCVRDATLLFFDGKLAQSVKQAIQAYADASAVHHHGLCADAALVAAKVLFTRAQYGECVTWATRAEREATQSGQQEKVAAATAVLASAMASVDDYQTAIKLASKSLQLLPDEATVEAKLGVFTGIGLTYNALGLFRHALEIFRRANDTGASSQIDATRKCRYLQNYIEGLLNYYEVVAPLCDAEATRMRAEAIARCEQLRQDARAAQLPHFERSARNLELIWGMASTDHAAVAQELLQFIATENHEENRTDEFRALLLLACDAHQNGDFDKARSYAKRAEDLQTQKLVRTEYARRLRNEVRIARFSGDDIRALTLQEKYFCFVLRNEHAAYDARIEQMNAAITAKTMQLQIVELQSQNVGLVKHFDSLSEQVLKDPLTEQLNRRGIEQRFDDLCRSNDQFCVAMIDIDHFKRVNDRFTHVVGDQVLKQVAQVMKHSLREHDVFGRFGGDEFLAFIRTNDVTEAHRIAERLRANVQSVSWPNISDELAITVCVGVCKRRADEPLIDLVRRVDTVMYEAKHSGRNDVSVAIETDWPKRMSRQ